MASLPQPPPPPTFDFSPPEKLSAFFHQEVLGHFLIALDSLRELHAHPTCQENMQARLWAAAQIRTLIAAPNYRQITPYIYATPNKVDDVIESISRLHDRVNSTYEAVERLPTQLPMATPPTLSPVDFTPVVTALETRFEELKKEHSSSFRSFAEAVKASPPPSPPLKTSTSKTKPTQTPRLSVSTLPQVVVRYRRSSNNATRPICIKIVESLNEALATSPSFKHVLVVGVKWTARSNLVVRARAPSPTVLVNALEAVRHTLVDDHRVINDITPSTRWSRVTVSHVYSGKELTTPAHSSSVLHEELAAHNPAYATLNIRQAPSWVRNPASFSDGQLSSITFAFDDPDGSLANKLIGAPFTAFGNLSCLVRPWGRSKALNKDLPKDPNLPPTPAPEPNTPTSAPTPS